MSSSQLIGDGLKAGHCSNMMEVCKILNVIIIPIMASLDKNVRPGSTKTSKDVHGRDF